MKPSELPTVRIGPVDVHETTTACVLDVVRGALKSGTGGRIATPNVDHLYRAEHDAECLELLAGADLRVADGMPLVWASRIAGTPLAERVAGADLVWNLAELARDEGVPLVLLGGTDESVEMAAERLRQHAPGGEVIAHSPPFGFEDDPVEMCRIEKLLDPEGTGIVLCALGFPKQERLAERLRRTHPRYWFIGCGAAIDMVAGRAHRAPDLLQRLGLEWTYRLVQEPRRLFRRYLLHDIPFGLLLLARSAASRLSPSSRRRRRRARRAKYGPPVFVAWGLVGRRCPRAGRRARRRRARLLPARDARAPTSGAPLRVEHADDDALLGDAATLGGRCDQPPDHPRARSPWPTRGSAAPRSSSTITPAPSAPWATPWASAPNACTGWWRARRGAASSPTPSGSTWSAPGAAGA